MDPFTQRMLERARARQEKIDQKLANSGQAVPKRKPLTENTINKSQSPIKSPIKSSRESLSSPKKVSKEIVKADKINSSPKHRSDVVVTKREFKSPKRGSLTRRNSDVSVEINISHRNDIQIEVQVEERDAPISIIYNPSSDNENNVVIKEIEGDTSETTNTPLETNIDMADAKAEKTGLRHNVRSRLDKLANLYSDQPLSSPIHRTEQDFCLATPPPVAETAKPRPDNKKKFGRLAALADQINNWEDDLTHHTFQQPDAKPAAAKKTKEEKLDASTLDVSIHSIKDINKVLQTTTTKPKSTKPLNAHTFLTPAVNECQRLGKKIVAELDPSAARAQTTPSAVSAPNMATMVVSNAVAKKPSIKKYKAPTPPQDEICDSEKDKENAIELEEEGDIDCIQTEEKPASSPKKPAHRFNNVDRSSVLSKAAMFEAGSPRAREKDPAEMSLRERKALFEKNKGAAIVPKAPFGLAPSVKTLHGDNKDKPAKPVQVKTPTKSNSEKNSRTNSKDSLAEDNISQSSLGGGIKGKLAALFNKEQTISETTIANKFKLEREKEMEMLQNRFHYKKPQKENDSDDDHSDHDPSEKAPLMGSTTSLAQANRKPEIIANIPKVHKEQKDEKDIEHDKIVGSQPVKRRSSQDSQVVLSVIDEVKRIKVNSNTKENGTAVQPSLYPHLSDIETDNSHNEEYSDCGGSRCGYYALECVFFFLCI